MFALHDWQNFYVLMGTASATLIGLLFVAVSIGAKLPREEIENNLRTFVNPTLIYYVQALLVSGLALMPFQEMYILEVTLVVLGIINIVISLRVFWRMNVLHQEDDLEPGHWIWHFLLPLLTGLGFVVDAVGLFIDHPYASSLFALATLMCIAIGLRNTWVLTVWLVMHREGAKRGEE